MSLNSVYCCNIESKGRVFTIPPTGFMCRVLVFLDECPICGRSRAIIKNIDFDGKISNVVNRSDVKALELLNRYNVQNVGLHKIEHGTKNNMGWYWIDGLKDDWVRDFNNKKVFKLNF